MKNTNTTTSQAEVKNNTKAMKKRLSYIELGVSFLCNSDVQYHASSGNPMEMFRWNN